MWEMHSLVKVGHDAVRAGGQAEYSIHDLSADIVACKLELIQSFSPVKQQSIKEGNGLKTQERGLIYSQFIHAVF